MYLLVDLFDKRYIRLHNFTVLRYNETIALLLQHIIIT